MATQSPDVSIPMQEIKPIASPPTPTETAQVPVVDQDTAGIVAQITQLAEQATNSSVATDGIAQIATLDEAADSPSTPDQKGNEIIYDDPHQDPLILETEKQILRATNFDSQVVNNDRTAGLDSYSNVWQRVNARENIHGWNDFIDKNPDKAKAYAERGHPGLKQVFEGRERLRQHNENQQRIEAARPKTIQEDATFRAFMDNPRDGLNTRVWSDVPRSESLTGQQYDEKARSIRAQMELEFRAQHPEVWAQFHSDPSREKTPDGVKPPTTTQDGSIMSSVEEDDSLQNPKEEVQINPPLYEAEQVQSEEEIGYRIKKQIPDAAQALDHDDLEKRRQELKTRPQIGSVALTDTLVGVDQSSKFAWVPTDKIVGKTWENPDGWASEIEARKGRVVQVAGEIINSGGDQKVMEHVFHINKAGERIKLTAINGPSGPMYYVDDGTHRVSACMAAGLTEIPCDIKNITYPLEQIALNGEQVEDWRIKIARGLIDGEINEHTDAKGNKMQKLVVKSEVLPWIRTTAQHNLLKISRIYEKLYPGSLDNLKIPRDALIDPVANNYFMLGRWEEWTQSHPK